MAVALGIAFVLLVLLAMSVDRSARRERDRMDGKRKCREEPARNGAGCSPFAGMPFSRLFLLRAS